MKYNTVQKNLIEQFFENCKGRLFTIDEIILRVPEVGKSTIYRQIAKMEKEGRVKKLEVNQEQIYYQYLESQHCCSHFHLVCTVCGSFIHLDEKFTKALTDRIKKEEGFELSSSETTFYGICKNCKEVNK